MVTITSVQHEIVKKVVKLHDAAGRKKENAFLVESAVFIKSFIEHGYTIKQLYATHESYEKHPFTDVPVQFVTNAVMNKMSQATTPSGYLAVFEKPILNNFSLLTSGIVLAQISDPGNMGTLIRSAAAFGYKSVVIVQGCDPFSYKVIQSTAGTLPLVNLFVCSWDELIKNARSRYELIALVARGGKPVHEYNPAKSLFVVGNEAHGLPQEWINDCDNLCTLHMTGAVESLNAAVAGSLVLALAQGVK